MARNDILWLVWAYYRGYDPVGYGNKLRNLSARNHDGEGSGFGQSDHSWSFKTKSPARKLYARLKRFKFLSEVRIERENDADDRFTEVWKPQKRKKRKNQ